MPDIAIGDHAHVTNTHADLWRTLADQLSERKPGLVAQDLPGERASVSAPNGQRLYGRQFPTYFGAKGHLRWRNLELPFAHADIQRHSNSVAALPHAFFGKHID